MKEYVQQFLKSKVYIFGITRNGLLLAYYLKVNTQTMLCFVDNDVHKQKQPRFMEIPCISVGEIDQNEKIIISTNTEKNSREIYHQLLQTGCRDVVYLDHNVIEKYAMLMSDAAYLKCNWYYKMGYELDLDCPKTFNEKLQWLKLYDRNPRYTAWVDKYKVKKCVAECIGQEYVIPTLGVWGRFEDIEFDALPDKFVLKCTHDSGSIVFCKGKTEFDYEEACKKLTKCLERNYFWTTREWPYKNVMPKIIAEPYMVDESGEELKDYKIQVFGEEPRFIQVDFGRFSKHERNLYNCEWEYIPASILYPTAPKYIINKPSCLPQILDLARKLSKGTRYVRTDFYVINGKIYFGELTFHHGSGYEVIKPLEFEKAMSEWLRLPFEVAGRVRNV